MRKLETNERLEDKTDWTRLASMTDADVDRAVAGDPDAAPILSIEQMRKEYRPARPHIKR